MSGHSKWSKVKHQKATTDVVKSAAFTKATHDIMTAVREGGGAKLRLAIEKARSVNMPKENIQRAIAKAESAGESGAETVYYEAYGPAGIAYMITVTTDNRNRSVAQIKNIIEHAGGTLVSPGALTYIFERQGASVRLKPGMGIAVVGNRRPGIDALTNELRSLDGVESVVTNMIADTV